VAKVLAWRLGKKDRREGKQNAGKREGKILRARERNGRSVRMCRKAGGGGVRG